MFTDNLMVSKIIYQKDGYIFILCSKFVVALSATLLHLKKIKLSTVSLFNVKEVISPSREKNYFCTRFYPGFAKSDCV